MKKEELAEHYMQLIEKDRAKKIALEKTRVKLTEKYNKPSTSIFIIPTEMSIRTGMGLNKITTLLGRPEFDKYVKHATYGRWFIYEPNTVEKMLRTFIKKRGEYGNEYSKLRRT